MKLALGTVQFGLNYGISNNQGRTSQKEVNKILKFAKESGINAIDTASSYGSSEEILGKSGLIELFKIITKTKTFAESTEIYKSDSESLKKSFKVSLQNLNCSVVEGLMIHHVKDLFKPGGEYLYEALIDLKEHGEVQKIGVSVYSELEIIKVLENYTIDVFEKCFLGGK